MCLATARDRVKEWSRYSKLEVMSSPTDHLQLTTLRLSGLVNYWLRGQVSS